ncbi:MAG TPA: glucokinase [Thermoanaerobaculia bacterium]|jgi:glucokinase|nr:glucokinase [Thermoanaerobaculia bacterium]
MILAGDVGGTKTDLGLFEREGEGLRLVRSDKFHSPAFPGLSAVVHAFLDGALSEGDSPPGPLEAACFGIPGPVVGNRASTPNLAWVVDGAALSADLQVSPVALINDLVATAEGIPLLGPEELAVLQEGSGEPAGNRALLAAGTGLGMALLPRVGERWVPLPSEGGHADYPPRTEDEIDLLRHLRERFGRVSAERVLSGPGLAHLYDFLRDVRKLPEVPAVREALGRGEDPGQVVGEAAMTGACDLCSRALDLFVAAYGALAGNLALLGTATGGVYLGGGIAPKILPRLKAGPFLQAFVAKGRFVPYLEKVPVRVIMNDRAALLGAARHAASLTVR